MMLPDTPPWSPAAAPVWALVCGYPGERRRKRQLLMLQAYIDDSHTTSTAFVLAGYIAPAENWAAFSDEWQAILDMKPPLKRLKTSEAHSTWSEQQWNERLPMFYRVIEDHVNAGISMLIPYSEYTLVFGDKKYAKNPYHFAFTDIIAQLAKHQHLLNLTEPVDFVFDRGNDERISRAWDRFFMSAPAEIKELIGVKPKFEDDEQVRPLQAGDLLAWWRRRNYEKRLNPALNTRPAPWTKSRELPYLEMEWTPERIQ